MSLNFLMYNVKANKLTSAIYLFFGFLLLLLKSDGGDVEHRTTKLIFKGT